jgi:hypothetical protein
VKAKEIIQFFKSYMEIFKVSSPLVFITGIYLARLLHTGTLCSNLKGPSISGYLLPYTVRYSSSVVNFIAINSYYFLLRHLGETKIKQGR